MYDLKIQLLLSCPDYIYYKIVTNIWPCYNYIFIWNKGKNIKTELSIYFSVGNNILLSSAKKYI